VFVRIGSTYQSTHQPTGILSAHSTTTYTSATCAGTSQTPVDVVGSLDRHFGPEKDEPDFVEFLEESTSLQKIGETSVDIYLRAAESSTELVALVNMEDYVIDINIYQYVLFKYILKLRNNYLNRYKKTWNQFFGINLIKKNV